tara:strand:- start:450 stop:752 length:303 start_codon:yes stop_codon:yes gene_type:complete
MKGSSGERDQILVTVSRDAYPALKDNLRTLAKREDRTLTNYVLRILVEHVKNHMSGDILGSDTWDTEEELTEPRTERPPYRSNKSIEQLKHWLKDLGDEP